MRRLYLQLYATVLAILAAFALLWSLLWGAAMGPHEARMFAGIARLAGRTLPSADAPPAALRDALAVAGEALVSEVSIYTREGRLAAAVGEPVPWREGSAALVREPRHYVFQAELSDGRRLVVRHAYAHGVARELAASLALLALLVALGAWPLVRRVTRRLERLRARVEALGAGDLAARVEVEGRDEVAALARSFNRAAERIERLVDAQRTALAGVSHELRTPLARIRVAAELLAGGARPELRGQIERDIAELDDGIDELLVASRLDAAPDLGRREACELLALVAEEAARSGALVSGEPAPVQGDPRLLRRLVRNLLENARRHGGGAAVEARVTPRAGGGVLLRVEDRGPGVPEAERERIFEPFYRPAGSVDAGGAGLGLALVRRIARHHGGEARCEPRAGGGTRFEVELSPTAGA